MLSFLEIGDLLLIIQKIFLDIIILEKSDKIIGQENIKSMRISDKDKNKKKISSKRNPIFFKGS